MMRIALIVVGALTAAPVLAEPLIFEGRVEAAKRAVVSTHLHGVVSDILFEGGERIEAGQPLIRLDASDVELALAAAEAAVALAEVERDRAAVDVTRAVIRAPIDGYVSRPAVSVGAFIEAEAGPPLAEIVELDPVVVAYRAPYADRLAALEATGSETVADLLSRVRVRLRVPGGRLYDAEATPHAASAEVDAETGAVTIWAQFPNPDAVLRPGMAVVVLSEIGAGETTQ